MHASTSLSVPKSGFAAPLTRVAIALIASVALLTSAPVRARAATWPILYLEPTFTGAPSPLFVTGDGTGARRYIVERGGRVLVAGTSSSTTSVFLDIRSRVSLVGERGLLGLAFSPQYAVDGRFFVYSSNEGGLPAAKPPFSRDFSRWPDFN